MSLSEGCVQMIENLFSWSGWDQWRFTSFFPLSLDHVAFNLTRTHSYTVTQGAGAGGQEGLTMSRAGFKGRLRRMRMW